ncbi:thioredoxin domain-containing protein 11-like [Glandiceps talaboti]
MQQAANTRSLLLQVMAQHPELITILIATLFTFFAGKISYSGAGIYNDYTEANEPRRIFPTHSPVKEYKYGNMQAVTSFIHNASSEVFFIMYYAHWDGTSIDAAKEYEKAAYKLEGEVTFIAVNCWWPKGSCRRNVPLKFYPMMMAYNTHFEGVQYHGILKAKHMVQFLKRICSPVSYVPDDEEMLKFIAQTESTVIGLFDFTKSQRPSGYLTYYQAALHSLEKDPIQPLQFGVITSSSLANAYGIWMPRTVFLIRMLNGTMMYPRRANFTAEAIVEWAYHHREKLIPWLVPSGTKSVNLSSQIANKPFVLLLTSDDKSKQFNSHVQQLREVALDYYNCNNSEKILATMELLAAIREKENEISQVKVQTEFSKPLYMSSSRLSPSSSSSSYRKTFTRSLPCCNSFINSTSGSNSPINTNYDICDVCIENRSKSPFLPKWCQFQNINYILDSVSSFTNDFIFLSNACVNFHNDYNAKIHFSVCCNHSNDQTYQPHDVLDTVTHSHHGKLQHSKTQEKTGKESCPRVRKPGVWNLQHLSSSEVVPPKYNASEAEAFRQLKSSIDFGGLGCNTNKSLKFFAMDSDVYSVYADRLGVMVTSKTPVLVLMDIKNEVEYVMEETFNMSNIRNFIKSYTVSELPRQLRTSQQKMSCSHGNVCIKEVTAETFKDIVLNIEKDVLLMYYAPWCGICSSIHHTYLSIVDLFQSAEHLTIARINGDINDLPWEFTATVFPTILFYPAGHKSWSSKFNQEQEITVENLSVFILENSVKPINL